MDSEWQAKGTCIYTNLKILRYMYLPEYNWYKGQQHKAAFIITAGGRGGGGRGTEDIF